LAGLKLSKQLRIQAHIAGQNDDMNERYSRQILFSGIGAEGQQRLLDSRVLVIGCGALGSAHVEVLARAGVGR
jgi:sulfur carrier protein ThiS adenylyltransferase